MWENPHLKGGQKDMEKGTRQMLSCNDNIIAE